MAENFYIRLDIQGDVKRVLDFMLDSKKLIGYSKVLPWVRDKSKANFVDISFKNISIDLLSLMARKDIEHLKQFANKFFNIELKDHEVIPYFRFIEDKFQDFDFDAFKPYRIPMKYIEFLLEENAYQADSLSWSDVLNAVKFNASNVEVVNKGNSLTFTSFEFVPEGYFYLLTEALSFENIPFTMKIHYCSENLFKKPFKHGRYAAAPHYIYDDYHDLNNASYIEKSKYLNYCKGIENTTVQDIIKLSCSLFDTEFFINNPEYFTMETLNKIFGSTVGPAVFHRFESMIL